MMRKAFALAMASAIVIPTMPAAELDPVTEVATAIATLGGKANYSWVATTKAEGAGSNAPAGPTEGKAEKEGLSYFKITMGDNSVEAAFKGTKSVIRTDTEWEAASELQGERAWMARRLGAFKAPVAEAQDLLGKVKALKQEKNGAYGGDLTETGARELLFARSRESQLRWPTGAKGWVKFWLKNGVVSQYQYNLQGRVAGQNQQEQPVNRTTTVEIKAIGSTKIQIPDEAKKKLLLP